MATISNSLISGRDPPLGSNFDVSSSNPTIISATPILPFPQTQSNDEPKDITGSKISSTPANPNVVTITNYFMLEFYNSSHINELRKLEAAFRAELSALEKKFDHHFKTVANFSDFKDSFDKTLKFLHKNQENFLPTLKVFLSKDDYEVVDLFLANKYDETKLAEPFFLFLQKGIEFYLTEQCARELRNLEMRHHIILETEHSAIEGNGTKLISDFKKKLSDKRNSSIREGGFKLTELISYQLIPIIVVSLVKSFNNKLIAKIFKQFFKLFKKGSKAWTCTVNREKKRIWINNLKPKISVTPKFADVLVTRSFAERVEDDMQAKTQIDLLLEKKKEDFNNKLVECKTLLEKLNTENEALNFVDFTAVLKENGFNFEGLESAPQSKEEWTTRFDSAAFKDTLCRRNVEHQITVAKLLQHGLENTISEKISIENKFLIFNLIKNIVEMISSLVQIILFIPNCAAFLANWGIDQLAKNLPIPGIEYTFILNPDIDLSLLGLAWMAISHMFGIYFKPNEYSVKGYWIDFQNKLAHVGYYLKYLILFIMKCSFKLTDILIEFCLRNKKSPISQMHSYQRLNDKLDSIRTQYYARLDDLKKRLNLLKQQDIKEALNPKLTTKDVLHTLRKYLSDNHFPKELLLTFDKQIKSTKTLDDYIAYKIDTFLADNHLLSRNKIAKGETIYQFDKVQVMLDALNSSKFSLFPEEVVEFFNHNFNIPLVRKNEKSEIVENRRSDVADEVNEFFITSDKNLFKNYRVQEEATPVPI